MPDPQFPVPASVDPRNSSVFDSPMTAAMRKLAGALQSGELEQVALGAGPSVARVPREATEALLSRLASSWGQEGMPQTVQSALQYLSQRFPRMLSHIEQVRELPKGVPDDPAGVFRAAEDGVPRIGTILVDPALKDWEMLDTITHELTHGGQALRAADRGLEFQPLYAAQRQRFGYYSTPYEIQARIAEANQAFRRQPGVKLDPKTRLGVARMWASPVVPPSP